MNRLRMLSTAVAGAALMLTTAACGSTGSSEGASSGDDSKAPYRVLVSAGLSSEGVLADNSNTSMLSAKASAAVLNEAGGILGREIEVTVVDDGGDPTEAVTKLREEISAHGAPDLYLNSGPSTLTAATLPILAQNNILSFNIGATEDSADPAKYPLNFDLTPSAADFIGGIGAYLAEEGYKTVGVIHGNTAYGTLFGNEVTGAFGALGIKVVANAEYDTASLDMTPQLSALKAKAPDAVVMDGYGAPVGYLLQGIDKLGWDVPIVGNTSVSATGLMSTAPPDGLVGSAKASTVRMQVFGSTLADPSATAVNEAVEAMSKLGEIKSTLILAYNYDALRLVRAAAEKVGSLGDSTKLAAALETDEVTTDADTAIISKYNFSSTSHSPNVKPDVFQFVAPSLLVNGQFQP